MQLVYNWHITEKCNYSCKYCFAKWSASKEIWQSPSQTRELLAQLKNPFVDDRIRDNFSQKKRIRLNLAGGEPLLLGNTLHKIVTMAKNELGFSCSIITNGSLLTHNIGIVKNLDLLGISIDSLNHETNLKIGRISRLNKSIDFQPLTSVVQQAREINPQIKIKFNIVANEHNKEEKLVPRLQTLFPNKIKIIQQKGFGNHDDFGADSFHHFVQNNEVTQSNVVVESVADLTQSYLMIDPQGRFYQNSSSKGYSYSEAIQSVGFQKAFKNVKFNTKSFKRRY